jgi:hypothetical protein
VWQPWFLLTFTHKGIYSHFTQNIKALARAGRSGKRDIGDGLGDARRDAVARLSGTLLGSPIKAVSTPVRR